MRINLIGFLLSVTGLSMMYYDFFHIGIIGILGCWVLDIGLILFVATISPLGPEEK